jgi:hypothetical protein
MKALIVVLIVLGFLGTLFLGTYISVNNHDARLRNAIAAKEQAREAVFDETWKSVQQVAQVANKYAEEFKKIYPELMAGRYGNARGGALLSFITEANPNFDTALYIKLANVIEAKRSEFTMVQKQLIDLGREHKNLLTTFPGSLLVRNQVQVEIKVISSERTKEVINSGMDNNIDVFGDEAK